jgi:hypothetical protein
VTGLRIDQLINRSRNCTASVEGDSAAVESK